MKAYIPLLLAGVLACHRLAGFDQSHFFQAQFFPDEPRYATADLTSVRLRAGFGITHQKNDACGNPSPKECETTRYRVHTVVIDAAHNFCAGFYAGATLPFYKFNIKEENKQYCVSTAGNLCLSVGWTTHYSKCEDLDFIDFAIETGVIAPTADEPLTAAGMPLRGVIAWGIYDWLTIGAAADVVTYFNARNGRLWDLSWFLEADHFIRGFSFGFGYTHSNQTTTPVPWLCDVNLPFWTMDTFSFTFGYDAACEERPYLPEVEFFYNHVLSGKNALRTPNCGISITSRF